MNKAQAQILEQEACSSRPKLHVIDVSPKRASQDAASLDTGTILSHEANNPGCFSVRTQSGDTFLAMRAAGCLLVPEPGDMVLFFRQQAQSQEEHYILNVLKKGIAEPEKEQEWLLSCPGDMRIASENGTCAVQGREVAITGTNKVSLSGHEVELAGVTGRMRFLSFSFVVKTMETIASRFVQRLGRCMRTVEYEHTKAGHINTRVEERYTLKAKDASVRAEQDVSIDGERILLS